jgi:hypothetical protein
MNGGAGRSRTAAPELVPAEALSEETLALVGEAQGLLRDYFDASSPDLDGEAAVGGKTVRQKIRQVRKGFDRMRRENPVVGGDDVAAPGPMSLKAKRARAQTIRQVLGLLTQSVLADGRVAGELRWPSGADISFALEEVIRVLAAQAAAGAAPRLPTGAGDTVPQESGE